MASPFERLVGTVGGTYGLYRGFKDAAQRDEEYERKKSQEAREIAAAEAESDPSSPISKSMRDQIAQVGIRVPETESAAQMKQNSVLMDAVKARISGNEQRKTRSTEMAKDAKPDQYKAALFGKRMQQAEEVFKGLEGAGFDPTDMATGAQRTTVFGIGVPERLKSSEVKQQEQAERNFLNAVLRRESGAAIAESEFESGSKQYFPRPGDSPEVLQQKAENRALAIQGLQAEAGPAWAKYEAPKGGGGPAASGAVPSAQASSKLSPEDQEALNWAKTNRKDPRAKQILLRIKERMGK